ncbi:MAG TPA: hypothetical protein VIY72_07725 [Acidimicrobiales bacterium]
MAGSVVMTVVLETEPEMLDELDEWYDTEHIPALLAQPGWLSARRFRDAANPNRVLAVYELEDESTFATTDFSQMAEERSAAIFAKVSLVDQTVWSAMAD